MAKIRIRTAQEANTQLDWGEGTLSKLLEYMCLFEASLSIRMLVYEYDECGSIRA